MTATAAHPLGAVLPTALRPTNVDLIAAMLDRHDDHRASRITVRDRGDDEARRAYNAGICLVRHAAMREAHERAWQWIRRNAQGSQPSRLLTLSGLFHGGKTEIAIALILDVCRAVWRREGRKISDGVGRHLVIPAVYVTAGGAGEADLVRALARGLQLPDALVTRNITVHDQLRRVADACHRSRTRLIVIDDVHMLPAGRGRHFTKFLKEVFSTLPVTLLFIADDVSQTVLLRPSSTEPAETAAAQQLQRRAVSLRCDRIPVIPDGARDYQDLLRAVCELQELRKPPDLPPQTLRWLHQACDGRRAKILETLIVAGSIAVGREERLCESALRDALSICGDTDSESP